MSRSFSFSNALLVGFALSAFVLSTGGAGAEISGVPASAEPIPLADSFDFPLGTYGTFDDSVGVYRTYGLCPPGGVTTADCYRVEAGADFLGTGRNGIPHLGEDWNRGGGATDYGDTVYAAANGLVVYDDIASGWGRVIIIRHRLPSGGEVETLYGHLSADYVDKDDQVTRGDPIGKVGDGSEGGTTYCPHLHLEVRTPDAEHYGSHGVAYSWNTAGWLDPSDFIEANRPTTSALDVFFLVDLSGSFIDDLPSFKIEAPAMVAVLRASFPNSRFGIGKYEDYPISPFGEANYGDKAYERLVDLTLDEARVLSTIEVLFTRSGGDFPQSQLPALFQAATGTGQDLAPQGFPEASIANRQHASFRVKATKLLLLWTDAPFHHPGDAGSIPYPGPNFDETVEAILALDPPKVIGVSSGPFGIPDLQAMAFATDSLAPLGGVDCNDDGVVDILEGAPLVCGITSSGSGIGDAIITLVVAAAPLEVGLDIKPGSAVNSYNSRSRGRIPVALLSTEDFDAPTQTMIPLLTFGRSGDEQSLAGCGHAGEDVNGDGYLDLVCHFFAEATNFRFGDTEGVLRGETTDGRLIEGTDSIRVLRD